MRTQHNFCTQQLRYVGITRIVILFGLNLCVETPDRQLPGGPGSGPVWGWSIPPNAHGWLLCGSPIRVSTTFILAVGLLLIALGCIANDVKFWSFYFGGKVENFVRVGPSRVSGSARRNLSPVG